MSKRSQRGQRGSSQAGESEFAQLTRDELRQELRGWGLSTSGTKAELIKRLESYRDDGATSSEKEEEESKVEKKKVLVWKTNGDVIEVDKEGRTCLQKLESWHWFIIITVPSLLLWVGLGAPLRYRHGSGDPHPSHHYPLYTESSLKAGVAGMLLSLLVFMVLDMILSPHHWKWAGDLVTHAPTTCEPLRPSKFIKRWRNSHSSAVTVGAGSFILQRSLEDASTRALVASLALGISMVLMGIVSHGWWGSGRYLLWRADHALMEGHTLALTVTVASIGFPAFFAVENGWLSESSLVVLCTLLWLVRSVWFMQKARLLSVACGSSGMLFFAIFNAGGHGDLYTLAAGFCCVILGFLPKLLDAKGLWQWGTASFHVTSSVGFVLLFLWAQSLPHLPQ